MDFKEVSFKILLAVCFVFGYCVQHQRVIACDPVDMLVLIDHTTHMTQDLKELQTDAVVELIPTLAAGSRISVVGVGETSIDAVLYKQIDDDSFKQSLKSVGQKQPLGNVISGQFLQNLIPKYFVNKSLKDRAQLVILMTSNNVDGFDTRIVNDIRTKITFVIGIGTTSLSDNLKDIAADKGHVAFLNDSKGVTDFTNTFTQLMCRDSGFVCDTEHYKIHNIKKCIQCDTICTSTIQSKSPACLRYCPYYTPPAIQDLPFPPRVEKAKHPTDPPFNDAKEKPSPDSKADGKNVVTIVAICITAALVVSVLGFIAYKNKAKWICKAKNAYINQNVHRTDAVEETALPPNIEGYAGGSNSTQATLEEESVRLTTNEVFKNQDALAEPMHDLSGGRETRIASVEFEDETFI